MRAPFFSTGPRRFFRRLGREGGAAAVEFAVIAPALLVPGCFLTVDVGLAVSTRMAMDQSLRTGIEYAISDPGTAKVEAVMARTSTVAGATYSATRTCECPNNLGVSASCTTLCPPGLAPKIFYLVKATKTYPGTLVKIPVSAQRLAQVS